MALARWLLIVTFIVACESDRTAATDPIRADFGRIGPIKLGMTHQELESTIGAEFTAGYTVTAEEESCYYLRSKQKIPGTGFMMDRNRLVRIDVWEPPTRTTTGVGVGSEEAAIQAAYDRTITVQPHKYTDGHYVIVDGDDDLKLLFETDAGMVTMFRTGRDPEVGYVEGCL